MQDIIMLRSDTATLPTDEMREAMRAAEVGDDVVREDPTVNRLEALAAEKMGKEAALFVASGTMGNLSALMAHGGAGDELICDKDAHMYLNEQGGMCSVAGYTPRLVDSCNGIMDPAELEASIRPSNVHYPIPRLLCLENTHNCGGGRVIPLELFRQYCEIGRQYGLKIHLDGARIFNAALGAGVSVHDFTREVDSVQFCLSKGLSAPVGSMVAGSEEFIDLARRARKVLGGGMRQAGVIAAAGIVALEKMVDRLQEDHANAALLAELIADIPGLAIEFEPVETNMVFCSVKDLGRDSYTVAKELTQRGLAVSTPGKYRIRMVTNRLVSSEDVRKAAEILKDYATEQKGNLS